MTARLGLFGGTFDPIHFGHLIAARSVAEQLPLDRVLLIPSAAPPHKPPAALTAAPHRLEMVRRAVAADPLFEVSDIELRRAGPSYTIDTVSELRLRLGPDARLFWIVGADSLPELAGWSRVRQLVETVEIIVAARPGWDAPDLSALRAAVGDAAVETLLQRCLQTPRIEISASEIRTRLAAGRPVRYLLPDAVADYAIQHRLYRG